MANRGRMGPARREVIQLGAVLAVAASFSALLRQQRPLGENVSNNSLALAVRKDTSSPAEGSLASDVTLIVFTDYGCPACRTAYPAMKRAVAKDGRVRIVYKDWPVFGPASKRAAEVALASTFQNLYPLVHDRLMTGPAGSDMDLKTAIEQSGGDWRKLQSDLVRNRAQITAQLARNRTEAFALGLGGTPGYLIGPILVRGALKESEFTRAVKEARQQSPN